jgi:hypothetical protein
LDRRGTFSGRRPAEGACLAGAQRIAAGSLPVVLDIITREEPVFSSYY